MYKRQLPNTAQRIVTTIITPYTSCAARLTIYLMIARIFFPDSAGTVIFSLYVLSLIMVVLGALILKPFFTKKTTDSPLSVSYTHLDVYKRQAGNVPVSVLAVTDLS